MKTPPLLLSAPTFNPPPVTQTILPELIAHRLHHLYLPLRVAHDAPPPLAPTHPSLRIAHHAALPGLVLHPILPAAWRLRGASVQSRWRGGRQPTRSYTPLATSSSSQILQPLGPVPTTTHGSLDQVARRHPRYWPGNNGVRRAGQWARAHDDVDVRVPVVGGPAAARRGRGAPNAEECIRCVPRGTRGCETGRARGLLKLARRPRVWRRGDHAHRHREATSWRAGAAARLGRAAPRGSSLFHRCSISDDAAGIQSFGRRHGGVVGLRACG